ncbi:MAG TPA: hypothetical protein PK668_23000 [Myxococcota bacterium]|nr:hypothetical protein [Myxococcota bacterium]HRY95564.1 hypothetical protein [Myxococcota bacterium]HSA22318.1 hypothetical protein [Myxococcota bacterium]
MISTGLVLLIAGLAGCAATAARSPSARPAQATVAEREAVPLERQIQLPLSVQDERDLRLLAEELRAREGLPGLRRLILGTSGSPLDFPVAKLMFLRELGGGRLELVWARARHRSWCEQARGGRCPEAEVVLERGGWRLLPAELSRQEACQRTRPRLERRPGWLPEGSTAADPEADWVRVGADVSCEEVAALERSLGLAEASGVSKEVVEGQTYYLLTIDTGSHSWMEQRYRLEPDGRFVLVSSSRAIS